MARSRGLGDVYKRQVSPSEAISVGQRAHAKVLDEQKMIADIQSGHYNAAWVDALIQQKGA
jgi:hypothetical protein